MPSMSSRPPYSPECLEGVFSQKLAWGTQVEDHIPCWANAVATLDSFLLQWMKG
jgi:hypothetical protein